MPTETSETLDRKRALALLDAELASPGRLNWLLRPLRALVESDGEKLQADAETLGAIEQFARRKRAELGVLCSAAAAAGVSVPPLPAVGDVEGIVNAFVDVADRYRKHNGARADYAAELDELRALVGILERGPACAAVEDARDRARAARRSGGTP